MSVTLKPATLLLAALAIAGAASGVTVVVMRGTSTPCVATTATPTPGAPTGTPTDAERAAADRRARARNGNAANGGRSF